MQQNNYYCQKYFLLKVISEFQVFGLENNVHFSSWGNYLDCMTELCVQARASPYKAGVDHYNVMNVNSALRIRLGLQRVSFVEIWSADLGQTRDKHENYTASRVAHHGCHQRR